LSISSKSGNKLTRPITDVIWIQTSFIGDIVLTTAAIKALHMNMPEVRQHFVTTPTGAKVMRDHPHLVSIHIFSKRDGSLKPMINVRASLKKQYLPKSTVILQPHKSLRSTLLSKMLGFPLHTYNETSGSWLATATVPRVAVLHESDRISLLLETIGLTRENFLGIKPCLPKAELPATAQGMVPDINWIGVAPGSVWATKRWPVPKFATLSQILLDNKTTGIVLLGSEEDVKAAHFIEESCLKTRPDARGRIINLAGKTALTDLNGIYPRLSQLISNDSSPIHYASAFNIPTVAIFGSTVPEMGFGPLADSSAVAQVNLGCRPCSDHGPTECPLGHFKCMNDLEVTRVKEIILHP
jgi:heptosyltransferase-2